tara:strand:+ start:594 stop:833 length:240 start_codon:yes stop_codon:yes gene_type:complete
MELERKIIAQVKKSKHLYAFSLIDGLVNSNDNDKIKKDLESVWKICGFKSQKELEDLFKISKGISLLDYCKKMNPSCNC